MNTLLPWGLNMDTVPGASAQCTGSAFSVWFPLRPSGTGLSSSSWKREKKIVCLQVKGMGSVLHHLLGSGLVGGPLAPDAGLSQTGGCVPGPSKQQGCSMLLSSGSAWIGLLGQTVGPEPPPTPIPSCHPEQTYSAWPSCTSFCSSSSTRASLALHWVTKCRISSLPSFPNMLAAALDRPRDYNRRQGKQESGRQM